MDKLSTKIAVFVTFLVLLYLATYFTLYFGIKILMSGVTA